MDDDAFIAWWHQLTAYDRYNLQGKQFEMSTTIYNIEFPKWFNDKRSVEQLVIRVVLAYLAAKETGVM